MYTILAFLSVISLKKKHDFCLFQDGATKILQSHLRANNEPDVLTPRNVASPQGQNRSRPPSRFVLIKVVEIVA